MLRGSVLLATQARMLLQPCSRKSAVARAWGPVIPGGSVAPCSSGAPAAASTSSHLNGGGSKSCGPSVRTHGSLAPGLVLLVQVHGPWRHREFRVRVRTAVGALQAEPQESSAVRNSLSAPHQARMHEHSLVLEGQGVLVPSGDKEALAAQHEVALSRHGDKALRCAGAQCLPTHSQAEQKAP